MRIFVIALALTLFPPGLAQKPVPQVLLGGRCHKIGDAVMKVRLQCTDVSGSLFCGAVSSTLRYLPKTEIAYSDADLDSKQDDHKNLKKNLTGQNKSQSLPLKVLSRPEVADF